MCLVLRGLLLCAAGGATAAERLADHAVFLGPADQFGGADLVEFVREHLVPLERSMVVRPASK